MSQWKSNANTTGAVKWGIKSFRSRKARGSGKVQIAANNVNLVVNVTSDAFTAGEADGLFPVTPGAKANTTGESKKVHGLGWALRTAGEGAILSYNASLGTGFANGETITVSNGNGANATLVITSNATSNLASVALQGYTTPTYAVNTAAVFTFTREKHIANLNFSNSTALVGVGAANVINFVVSNTGISYGINGIGSFTSNSLSGFGNAQTQAVTWAGANIGLFANNQTNAAVVVTFTNANGTLVTGTYVATVNLVTSTAGTVTANALGGRAGRVTYELLVVDRNINATCTTSVANSVALPQ